MASQTIKLRHDTAARWAIVNPVLEVGEFGFETDTGRFKIGDDLLAWDSLPYRGEAGGLTAINVSAGVLSQNLSALTFQNSNGVTFGLDALGVVTASVAPGGGGNGSVNLSAGTTSNAATAFTFANSNGVSFGLNASTLTATVRTDYQSAGNYLTTAALSQDSSKYVGTNGALTGGSITLNTSGLSINLPAYLTTAMQSNAATISNAKLSAGTLSAFRSDVTFGDSNGISFGLNTNGVLTGTVATNYQAAGAYLTTARASTDAIGLNTAQSNVTWTANSVGLSLDARGYAGTGTSATNASVTLNSNGIAISVPSVGGAQTAISGLAAGGGTITSGTASFSNASGVSFGVNGQTITASVRTDYQSAGAYLTTAMQSNAVTLSNAKVSAGTLSALRSDVTFGDSNGVSFGLNTNGVLTATVATNYQSSGAYLTTAALSGDSSKYAGINGAITGGSLTVNTSGVSINLPAYLTTAMLSNAVTLSNLKLSAGGLSALRSDLTFSDSNGVSFGLSANGVITATVATNYQSAGAYLTTAALSQDSSKYAGTNGAITGGSITVNTSGVSVNLPAYLTTAGLSGDSSKYVQEWALTGNTAGTTSSAQGTRLYLSGGNGLTISGSSNSLVFSVGNYLTTAALSADSSKYAGTNGAITGGSITVNTAGVSVNLPAYLTTAALSADSSKYAATGFTTTTGAGSVIAGTHDTAGLKLAVPAFLTTAMQSNAATISNINVSVAGASANLSNVVFSNSNNVTWGLNGSTVTVAIPSASVITLSAGAASQTFGNVVFSNSNRVSFGLNGSTVTAEHALNISAGSTSAEIGDQIVFSNSNGYSFGLNGSTVTAKGPYAGWLEPNPMTNTALFAPGAGTWYLAPFTAFNSMSGGRINFLMQNTSTAQLFRDFTEASVVSSSTGGQQQGYTYSLAAAIFSQGTGTNSTRLESAWSNAFSFGWTKLVSVSVSNASNINVSVGHTLSYISDIGTDGAYTLGSYTNSSASTVANSSTASNFADSIFSSGRNLVSGSVVYPVGLNTTLSAGAYWLGFAWSTTRSNASTGTRISTALDFSQSSIVGISRLELNSLYRNWGSTATSARSHQIPYGLYTAAANMVPPAAIAISSDLSSLASQWLPYFNIQFRGLTK